jgi:nuclear cap-binding protein subunit 1
LGSGINLLRVGDIDLSDVHPKKSFMSAALDKEIRLSFAQRIKGTLPEPHQALIPSAKEKDTPDFKYGDEKTPFASQGSQIAQLIRRKGTDTEIAPLLQEIEQEAAAQNLDPLLASTDAYVTSICYVGSKSLSHVLSCIERCKDRLLSLGPASPAARRQIITSVMGYWADQPGVGVNIVDKLLNYTILTPASVVEWALIDHVARGTILAKNYAYEMISLTMTKVTKRVRQIVEAIRRPGLPEEQTAMLQETLERERGDMQRLFGLIEDSLVGVANGNNDEVMESSDGGTGGEEEKSVRRWGGRWMRVFQRRYAVEESWIREELVKPLPEPEPEVEEVVKMNDDAGPDGDAKRRKNGESEGNSFADFNDGGGDGGQLLDMDGVE